MEHKVGYVDKESAAKISPFLDQEVSYQIEVGKIGPNSIKLKLLLNISQPPVKAPKPSSLNKAGIYKISVEKDKYVYIGQSTKINVRIQNHWDDLTYGNHTNKYLQAQWNEQGDENFSAHVIEHVPEEINSSLAQQRWLAEREQYWISEYRKSHICLNITDGEIIETKSALREFDAENKAHDQCVKEKKKIIKAEIEKLEVKARELRNMTYEREEKVNKILEYIRKNSGIIGFFLGSASKQAIESKEKELDIFLPLLTASQAELKLVWNKIFELKEKHRSLKTIKQQERFINNKLIGFGVYRSSKKRIY